MADLLLCDRFHATPQRFLWHPDTGTAILADVHLGIESSLASRGLGIPPFHLAALQQDWAALRERLAAAGSSHLIIGGDLFDSPFPDNDAIQLARQLLQQLPPTTAITVVPGNHDPAPLALREYFGGLPVQIAPAATVGGYTVVHGHQSADIPHPLRGLIVGHQHPAVVLRNRVQSAKMICFAVCKLRVKPTRVPTYLIVLPTFSRMPLGSNLLTDRHWILDLPRPGDEDIRIAGMVEHAEGDRVLNFGALADLVQ